MNGPEKLGQVDRRGSSELARMKIRRLGSGLASGREAKASLEKRVNALDSRHGNLMLRLRSVLAKAGLKPAHHNNG